MTTPQEDASSDLRQLQAQLASLRQKNQAGMAALARMGAQLDGVSVIALRVDTFIGFIFARMGTVSDEIRQTLVTLFEIEFEERMTESVKDVQAQIRKAMLASGGAASQQDLKKMWQAQQNGHSDGMPPGFGG
jgi:hypothetical protein